MPVAVRMNDQSDELWERIRDLSVEGVPGSGTGRHWRVARRRALGLRWPMAAVARWDACGQLTGFVWTQHVPTSQSRASVSSSEAEAVNLTAAGEYSVNCVATQGWVGR